ncbi:MAG: hypothetical protein Q8K45_01110 [Rubrivivax sp.]|nr:hypothetical protein [Rubrivivax sp.]
MYDNKTPLNPTASGNLVDQAAAAANNGINATQHALDGLAGSVKSLRDQASPRLDGAKEQAGAMLHRGMDALRDGSHQVRAKAHQASESTTHYIQAEPVKAVLIAAAAGAALMALVSLMTRSRRDL